MEIVNILSVDDLIRKFSLIDKSKKYYYRGQRNSTWGLVPSFYRGLEKKQPPIEDVDGEWIGEAERDIYREFKLTANREVSGKNELEILAYAQHHGVPTRLLDWTRNFYTATYFALMDATSDNPAIWCINITDFPHPTSLGRQHIKGAFRIENINHYIGNSTLSFCQQVSKPIIGSTPYNNSIEHTLVFFEPPHIDERIVNQDGLFSVYLSLSDYDFVIDHKDFIKNIETKYNKALITEFIIDNSIVKELQIYLEQTFNIDPYKLYPDLMGLGMKLNNIKNRRIEEDYNVYKYK